MTNAYVDVVDNITFTYNNHGLPLKKTELYGFIMLYKTIYKCNNIHWVWYDVLWSTEKQYWPRPITHHIAQNGVLQKCIIVNCKLHLTYQVFFVYYLDRFLRIACFFLSSNSKAPELVLFSVYKFIFAFCCIC